MTHALGQPHLNYVLPGEGNTSARINDGRFWIKASGVRMADVCASDFLRINANSVLSLLEEPPLQQDVVRARFRAAKVDPNSEGAPSIETIMHALCLRLAGVQFVGHTHPTAINAILCARDGEAAFTRTVSPAEAVICGQPLFIPYAPMGQPLAKAVQAGLETYQQLYGERPRVILLQNHGLVALAETMDEVLHITATMVKTAQILLGTAAFGGPNFIA
jgi:rhamnose utilization protein RhaD (predicted bifunctional aldolase and dehydrogenase)